MKISTELRLLSWKQDLKLLNQQWGVDSLIHGKEAPLGGELRILKVGYRLRLKQKRKQLSNAGSERIKLGSCNNLTIK